MAVKLDGKTQYLGKSASLINLGISNTWTLGFWAKPSANPEFATIFSTGIRGKNEIQVSTTAIPEETLIHGKRPAELRVLIKDAAGTVIKRYGWKDHFYDREWAHTTIQWDGSSLTAYKDAVAAVTGTVLVNSAGTMTDEPNRNVFYGSAVIQDAATFSGIIGHFGMWDSLLTSTELLSVVASGHTADLRFAFDNYVSDSNLYHYWKPGQGAIVEQGKYNFGFFGSGKYNIGEGNEAPPNVSDFGEDFTIMGNRIDLTKVHNLDASSAVSEDPP